MPLLPVLAILLLINCAELAAQTTGSSQSAQAKAGSPLWGELVRGRYPVGFRRILRFDSSRTWRTTRSFEGKFSPDPHGRPVQLNVWYPAATGAGGRRMTLGAYLEQPALNGFEVFSSVMKERSRENLESSVTPTQRADLLALPLNSAEGAKP